MEGIGARQADQEILPPPSPRIGQEERKKIDPPIGRVLIVEDETELLDVLEFNLARSGFEVLTAEDGLEACRMIGQEKPDLILLDLMLPLLDGWEVCRMVRSQQDPLASRVPIIILSALNSDDDRLKGYDLGADLYLPKPYMIKEVILKSRQLIEQRHDYLSLSQQVSSLQQWNSLQNDWQHALFHELRNQLTVISGMAEYLQKTEQLPNNDTRDFVEQISSSSEYLGNLAMNYLLIRQVEEHPARLQLQPRLLQQLLAELKALFATFAEQRRSEIYIDCPPLPPLELHPVGLKIVLSSLLDNAIKYSPSESVVRLGVTLNDRKLQIRIHDNGPGIAPEERDEVFKKFVRGKETVGSGLGLYMARTLTEAMGGDLKLLDSPEPGCCLQLTFPEAANR